MKKFCAHRFDYCSIFAPSVEVHFNIQIPQAPMGRKDGANIVDLNSSLLKI